jgi:hypothetical protein
MLDAGCWMLDAKSKHTTSGRFSPRRNEVNEGSEEKAIYLLPSRPSLCSLLRGEKRPDVVCFDLASSIQHPASSIWYLPYRFMATGRLG